VVSHEEISPSNATSETPSLPLEEEFGEMEETGVEPAELERVFEADDEFSFVAELEDETPPPQPA
jgi:hypothetical protein